MARRIENKREFRSSKPFPFHNNGERDFARSADIFHFFVETVKLFKLVRTINRFFDDFYADRFFGARCENSRQKSRAAVRVYNDGIGIGVGGFNGFAINISADKIVHLHERFGTYLEFNAHIGRNDFLSAVDALKLFSENNVRVVLIDIYEKTEFAEFG